MQRGTTGPYMVYLLADQRAGPYVVGVGGELAEVVREVREVHFQRECRTGDRTLFPFCLVWLERTQTHAAACERAAQIRSWPHRWQRRLVESVNPDWREWSQTECGFPRAFWQCIPERVGGLQPA
jgi:predicted GIY-YIG superfamily endonuclease